MAESLYLTNWMYNPIGKIAEIGQGFYWKYK